MPKIFLVEDMPDALRAMEITLQMNGYDVVGTIEPCKAATLFAEKGPFDLVILDVAMPTKNGFAVADEIRAIDGAARIAFMTAYDDPLSVGRAEVGGSVGFWSKPYVDRELLANVAAAVEGMRRN